MRPGPRVFAHRVPLPPVPLTATFLTDGGQDPLAVAGLLAAHIGGARATCDIAIYDLALDPGPGEVLRRAVRDATARGVRVRLVYNQERARTRPLPPPGFVDHEFLRSLDVPSEAVPGSPDLMHHKYIVVDGASVWTGSTNWTNDSWSREENVIVRLDDPVVAAGFTADFEELWTTRSLRRSGRQPATWAGWRPGSGSAPTSRPGARPSWSTRSPSGSPPRSAGCSSARRC